MNSDMVKPKKSDHINTVPLSFLCEQPTAQQLSGILKLDEHYFANH